jgi:hypothetical protein
MDKRTLILFAGMLLLFAIYATVSLQAMPAVTDGMKKQTELLNSMDEELESSAGTE